GVQTCALPISLERAADQIRLLRLGGTGAALIDNGNGAAQLLLMNERPLDTSLVRTQDHKILGSDVHATNVFVDDRCGVEVVNGDVEEPLNLGGVQIQSQCAVGASPGHQVGDEFSGNRHPAHVFAVLARV